MFVAGELHRSRTAAHFDSGLAELRDHLRQKKLGNIFVDQQSFQGIAGRGILHFGIENDVEGFLQIRIGMDVHVADTLSVSEDGNAAVLGHVADKFVRAARDD